MLESALNFQLGSCFSRFLGARKFNLPKAKTMIQNCLEWRRTVCGDGIDAVYRRIDPYDVSDMQLSTFSGL